MNGVQKGEYPSISPKDFCEKYQRRLGLSRKELADIFGVTPKTFSHWASGRREGSPWAHRLAGFLEWRLNHNLPLQVGTSDFKEFYFKSDLSQQQVAELFNVNRNTIRRWCSGRAPKWAARMAEAAVGEQL